ncbi:c-type cytochrome [Flavobacterium aquicola]|uniref:Cbb3-type cytochrome c oxidase subunit III n=1 Tax=Flavobacterium aquicola TaxID=1682742 RepID=A0A3E0ES17_9FLAO|nr:c-type cytochrome [Flavobacterium aquicola]REH01023.1 cbb3-type cytochrome c oxidase subunit III [Flavobacterium aquicola]
MKAEFRFLTVFALLIVSGTTSIAQEISWSAPEYSSSLTNPFVGNKKAANEGKVIFDQMCVLCHGNNGQGNGEAGQSLSPQPANLVALNVKNQSDGAIFWKITNGRAPMAPYFDLLNDDQRWKLVNYIRELEKK